MPIWSLTNERLEKLKNQIAAKKAEYDELNALDEKDLWVKDLDEFVAEWEEQLRLDEEITTGIRRMGRRTSQKIGAGKGRRLRDDDDEYQPQKKTKSKAVKVEKAEKVEKVETKTHQRFAEKFQAAAKPKPENDLSDDDFELLGKKAVVKEESDPVDSVANAANGPGKRAAATKAKSKYVVSDDSDEDFMELDKPKIKDEPDPSSEEVDEKPKKRRAAASKAKSLYVEDDDSDGSESDDDDKMLGDVSDMVKGIGAPASSSSGGRLGLFSMSRPEAGDAALSKVKSKTSKAAVDTDSHDDTNYEALAMSSPRKPTKTDDLDDFLSDDDPPKASKAAAKTSQTATSKAKAPLSVVPAPAKRRGRPPGSKNKPKTDDASAAKAKTASKTTAAKKAKAKKVVSDDDDDEMDDIVDEPASPPPEKPKARPGRAAAAKAKPIYIDDDEDDSLLAGGSRRRGGKKDDDSDEFDLDEDSD